MFKRWTSLFFILSILVAEGALAQAPGAPAGQPAFGQVFVRMLPMFAIVFLIFYFMVIKPQQSKLRQQEQLLSSLKNGELVVTNSGIIGRVAGSEKDYILLEISNGVRVKVTRDHVARRYQPEGSEKKAA